MLATVETQFDLIGFHNKKLQVYKNVMQINWTKQPRSGQDTFGFSAKGPQK